MNRTRHCIRLEGKGTACELIATKGGVRVGAAYSNSISSIGTLIFHFFSAALRMLTRDNLRFANIQPLQILSVLLSLCVSTTVANLRTSLVFLLSNKPRGRLFKMLPRPLWSFRAVADRRTRGRSYRWPVIHVRQYSSAVSTLQIRSKGLYPYTARSRADRTLRMLIQKYLTLSTWFALP